MDLGSNVCKFGYLLCKSCQLASFEGLVTWPSLLPCNCFWADGEAWQSSERLYNTTTKNDYNEACCGNLAHVSQICALAPHGAK